MKLKKLLSAAIFTTLLLTGISAYGAEKNNKSSIDAPATNENKLPETVLYQGVVDELVFDGSSLAGVVMTEQNEQKSQRRFNFSKNTVILDNELGIAQNLDKIKVGEKISIYSSPISTFSIPPQSSAYVVLINIQKKSPAKLIRVQDIQRNKDKSITLFDTQQEYNIDITKTTVLMPYKTKQLVKIESIAKDDLVLVWSEIMTLSIPAKITADRAVLLNGYDFKSTTSENKIILSTQAGVISVNGKEIILNADKELYFKNKNGTYMLPLKAIAEVLGYKVQWTNTAKRVDIIDGAKTYTTIIGSKDYGKQKMRVVLKTASEIKKGITYVPIEFFSEIMEVNTSVNNNHV
jgi:hypothetical protein